MASQATSPGQATPRTRRIDAWWLLPATVVTVLTGFVIYTTWAGLQDANYFKEPYISPFYSPCLAAHCSRAVTIKILGSWWALSPAILILAFPGGFRLTCYY